MQMFFFCWFYVGNTTHPFTRFPVSSVSFGMQQLLDIVRDTAYNFVHRKDFQSASLVGITGAAGQAG